MAGRAMITIEASMVAMLIASVVFDNATHLYRSGLTRTAPAGRADGCA